VTGGGGQASPERVGVFTLIRAGYVL
jgi:hypothetical protein